MQRRIQMIIVAFVLFCSLFGMLAWTALAQEVGTIAGKVTGDGNAPLAGIYAVAYNSFDGFSWQSVAEAVTDENGNYTLTDLAPNTYRVGFISQSYPREYFDAYYGNVTDVYSATDIIVTAGATVQNINIQLPSGAHIKGRVTGPAGENLQDIQVAVNGIDIGFQKAVTTNANGRYDIGGMEAGTYQLSFSDTRKQPLYATEWFNNVGIQGEPSPIALAKDQIRTGINAQLDRLGVIQGRVTDIADEPIANITVIGQRYDAVPPYPGWYNDAYSSTDANGVYTMTGLYADTYRVMFRDNQYGLYSFEWFDNRYDPDAATLLTVTFNATTTNINAQLDGRGTISGVVTDEQGNPLVDMTVRAEYLEDETRQLWQSAGEGYTDANGHYTICCLNPQAYRISFSDSLIRYIAEYYDDIVDPSTFEPDVTLVPVTATQTTPNINAKLARYSTIAGTVTDGAGQPLSNVTVEFYRADGSINYASTAYTDNEGHFDNSYLLPGNYRLYFYDNNSPANYFSEYYNNAPDLESATDVHVGKEETVTVTAALVAKSRITGTVTDLLGTPLSIINVVLYSKYEANDWFLNSSTTTDENGHYLLGGLGANTYRIGFEDTRFERQYVNKFYKDAPSVQQATDIVIGESELVPNIDIQLAQLGSISGEVTNDMGDPLQSIVVIPHRYRTIDTSSPYWEAVGYAETNETGGYTLMGLEPGQYRLSFQDYNGTYQNEWYDNQGYEAAATVFELAAEQHLTGYNAQLATEPFTWPPFADNDTFEVNEGVRFPIRHRCSTMISAIQVMRCRLRS
ncbi:MAG: carboxypeptidase-like regulatory domain-containing protein [Caldilineaceae bacterium]